MTTDQPVFGFTVQREDAHLGNDLWSVSLPHQCDAWAIAGEDYGAGVPHAEAVGLLAAFIAEAQTALAALSDRREIDEPY